MSAHTPGPWHMAGPVGNAVWIQSDDYPNIAAVHKAFDEIGRANAQLIAAAPELAEALHVLFTHLPIGDRCLAGCQPGVNKHLPDCPEGLAHAALKKAGVL